MIYIYSEGYYFNRILRTETPLKIIVRKSKKFNDGPVSGKHELERYVMRSKPRGFVLLICNIDYESLNKRVGAQHDEDNLKKLFEDMGFEVTLAHNLTGAVSYVSKLYASYYKY